MRKRVEELAGRGIPHLHAAAVAGRGQPLAVLAKRQRANALASFTRLGETEERLATCLRVPQLHNSPTAPRRQPPIATERHAERLFFVSREGVQELILRPIPDLHRAVTSSRELSTVET